MEGLDWNIIIFFCVFGIVSIGGFGMVAWHNWLEYKKWEYENRKE